MLVLMLKRSNTALDRDVIFLAESGEEGSPEVGAQYMIDNHFDAILEAELYRFMRFQYDVVMDVARAK
jgi:acetylornithine deacetylase/succinyl-diaminopimelate desuccinylase-like protein